MASLFRTKIAHKVISTIQSTLQKPSYFQNESHILPQSITIGKRKNESSQLILPWQSVINMKPELEERLHPETLVTYLRNEGLPTAEGITDISLSTEKEPNLVFTVDPHIFTRIVLLDICVNLEVLAENSCFFQPIPKQNIIVEFSSPNVAKSFHVGHFRSTIIGNFVANIHQFLGHNVTRINYLGDWGQQYGILAAGYEHFGSEDELNKAPMHHLYEVYKAANVKYENDEKFKERAKDYFHRMEEGNDEFLSQWNKFRKLSLAEFNTTYQRLGIQFDEIHGESMYVQKVQEVIKDLLEKGLIKSHDDGSLEMLFSSPEETETNIVLCRNDGSTLYISRFCQHVQLTWTLEGLKGKDIAAAIDRKKKFDFDVMHYVVDKSQSDHFKALISILKSMGYTWSSDIHHVKFGRINNLRTRKGEVVFLHDVLNEAQVKALDGMMKSTTTKVTDNLDEIADVLGLTALIINDLRISRMNDYSFSWETALQFKGNSGITLQYCHARLCGIENNCGIKLKLDSDLSPLIEPEALDLIQHLAKFDEVLYHAYTDIEPCYIVQYLFRLCKLVGKANKVLNVKKERLRVARARLLLFHSTKKVFHKSLTLLGIKPLYEM